MKFADTTPFPGQFSKRALTHCVEHPESPILMMIDLSGEFEDIVLDAESFYSRPAGNMFINN
ncbi:hypothetical protein, partial [Staphylococcus aureus]